MSLLGYIFLAANFLSIAANPTNPTVVDPTELMRISMSYPAFANVVGDSLFVSSFSRTADQVIHFPKPKDFAPGEPIESTKVDGDFVWPNQSKKSPTSLFQIPGVVTAGGFLAKPNGGIWFTPKPGKTTGQSVALFRSQEGYFYHSIEFYDVDQDGHLDILTCRAKFNRISPPTGDLTYLTPVDRSNPTGPSEEHIIGKGCDTLFHMADIDEDGQLDIISTEFWGRKLTLIQTTNGRFDNYSDLVVTTIDSTIGGAFDSQLVDINGDGKLDLIATNHNSDGTGALYAYEIPQDVSQPWTRHALSTGFPVNIPGPGQASPGGPHAYMPEGKTGKPFIVVSGDATKKAHLVKPVNEDTNDWNFVTTELHDCNCTVGHIAIEDFNKNGKPEIYIPCYESGYIAIYE